VIRLTTYDSLKRSLPPTFLDPLEVSSVVPSVNGPDKVTLITMKNGTVVVVTETPEEVQEAIHAAKDG
jgi:uncharacterized protein YlzI (FlbEa/FlbD family)